MPEASFGPIVSVFYNLLFVFLLLTSIFKFQKYSLLRGSGITNNDKWTSLAKKTRHHWHLPVTSMFPNDTTSNYGNDGGSSWCYDFKQLSKLSPVNNQKSNVKSERAFKECKSNETCRVFRSLRVF